LKQLYLFQRVAIEENQVGQLSSLDPKIADWDSKRSVKE
jgi:hypothetical protein